MLSHTEYLAHRKAIDDQQAFIVASGKNSFRPDEYPEHTRYLTNDIRSAVEVYEFMSEKPTKYFAYVKVNPNGNDAFHCYVTTWTGEVIGSGRLGYEYRDSFGGRRQSIEFLGYNGRVYSGTFYKSAGDYCRVKAVKRERPSYTTK